MDAESLTKVAPRFIQPDASLLQPTANDHRPSTNDRCAAPSHIMKPLAAGPDGRSSQDGRKVRTPQSSVPDNVREAGFKPGRRKVPQKIYRPGGDAGVRVKRCGKG